MTRDRCTGLIALILGLIAVVAIQQIPPSIVANDAGPRVFPYIAAGILILCGGLLVIVGKNKQEAFFSPAELKRLFTISGLLLLYCIAMVYLGYFVPTAVALFLLCTLFDDAHTVALWKRLLFSVVLTAAVYYIFVYIFVLKLPVGKFFV